MTQTERLSKEAHRKAIISALSCLDWKKLNDQICNQLIHFFQASFAEVIAGYSAHRFEADLSSFLQFWHEKGGVCCLPAVTQQDHPLIFRQWNLHKPLIKGRFGILVPDETEEEIIPDIILTPLVAFDKYGVRLGRGGGYYDRTLALLRQIKPHCQVVGIGCQQQYVDTLPYEVQDQKLDMVITESQILSFSKMKKS